MEKEKTAVSMRWDGTGAPEVTAKGRGLTAAKIIELAELHNIPCHSDPALVSVLMNVGLNEEIPPELYLAAAKVIAFAYQLREQEPLGHSD